MVRPEIRKTAASLAVAGALAVVYSQAHASGFALMEQNASGLGNAFAGAAAVAEDASTIFYNAAGLSFLPKGSNFAIGAEYIDLSTKFHDSGSVAATGRPLGTEGGDAGKGAAIPSVYFAHDVAPNIKVGIGVNAPFGLKTEYSSDWIGRFHGLKSEVKTININPSVAFKVNDAVSIGGGLNWQRIDAELTKAVNYSFLASAGGLPGVPVLTEGSNKIEGDDTAWGYNLGVLFKLGPQTDVGISYRSKMSYKLSGDVHFFGRPAAVQAALAVPAVFNQAGDSNVTADLTLPDTLSFAVKHDINQSWQVLADVTRTGWSSLDSLRVIRTNGALLEETPFSWRNTWRAGLGVNYRVNQPWTLRFGVAYDQTPTKDEFRTPRIPDQNRTWLAIGAQYKVSQAGAIDFGYAHLFVRDATVNLSGPPALTAPLVAGRGALRGSFDNSVDILAIQYRHNF